MLIGLHGPKQAGKDTVYARAAHILADVVQVERASFADLLYASAAASLGVTEAELGRWKNDPAAFVIVKAPREPERRQTVREYLQRYGTEAHREIFYTDFWVDNVRLDHKGRVVFVTDVRFDNEARAVRDSGGTVVRVWGPDEVEQAGDGHASEVGLSEPVDLHLSNRVRDDGFRALDSEVAYLVRGLLVQARL